MNDEEFDWDPLQRDLSIDEDGPPGGSKLLRPPVPADDADQGAFRAPAAEDPAGLIAFDPAEAPATTPPPAGPPLDGDGIWRVEASPELQGIFGAWPAQALAAAASEGDIDPVQILRDRPDVHAAFFREFYGPNNDRDSPAWMDRVGGETPEDFARYWYGAHGRFEGYAPGAGLQRAAAEGATETPGGRTTIDGIPLSQILADRPDVFQAFFTEYYGQNNDRHSDAWANRVGGATVEDYANYWYNAHGRVEGYVPTRPAKVVPELIGAPDPALSGSAEPPPSPVLADGFPLARPLVVHETEDGIELLPATPAEMAAMRSLFDDLAF